MDANIVLQVVGIIATGGAMYGAIRSDLRGMVERIGRAERATEENAKRIEQHIEFHLHQKAQQ